MQTTVTQSTTTLCTLSGQCFTTSFSVSEWAAWVQALGSIAAIGAAAELARRQFNNAVRLEEFRRRSAANERISLVRTLFSQVKVMCEHLASFVAAQTVEDRSEAIRAIDGTPFEKSAIQLEALPLLDIPSGELAAYVINAPHAVDAYLKALEEAKKQAFLFPLAAVPGMLFGDAFQSGAPRHRVPTIRTGPHPLRTTSLTTNPSTHGNCKEIPDRSEEAPRLYTRIEAGC